MLIDSGTESEKRDAGVDIAECRNNIKINAEKEERRGYSVTFYTNLQIQLLNFLTLMKHYLKHTYIFLWHDLSMDPAVRKSPYHDPPENEVKLTFTQKFGMRSLRLALIASHVGTLIGLYYALFGYVKIYTILWTILLDVFSMIGVCAGAHRLWAHRSYKATWQVRFILMIFYTMTIQYSLYYWAHIHRVHHRHVDTEADPTNSNRGVYFSHFGWLIKFPRPEVTEKLRKTDMSDIEKDKIVMFNRKYYLPLVIVFAYLIPTFVPWYIWGEHWWMSHLASMVRHTYSLHAVFIINSLAHRWGMKPYDKSMNPTDNTILSILTTGEGWHNYHHVFPWDYRSSEFWDYKVNLSTGFIDLFSLISWTYDMKTVSPELVRKRVKRTGDGSEHKNGWMGWAYDFASGQFDERKNSGVQVWGWDDPSMSKEDRELAEIKNMKSE